VTPALAAFIVHERKRLKDLRQQLEWLEEEGNALWDNEEDVTATWHDTIAGWIAELEALIAKYDPEGLTAE